MPETPAIPDVFRVVDLGAMNYQSAFERQVEEHARVLSEREAEDAPLGTLLLVEHDPPVITISRRPGSANNLLVSETELMRRGIEVSATDRGGDITYHGPGQLVVYPIVDLNRAGMNLHAYMRALEASIIRACAVFGVTADRDACATGVWVGGEAGAACGTAAGAKICAMGVRVRRWVSMHGLALNVAPDLSHFDLIVPCGLAGRPVTSLKAQLGAACPGMPLAKTTVAASLAAELRPTTANNR